MLRTELGEICCTAGVHALAKAEEGFYHFLDASFERYLEGDFGETSEEEKFQNDKAARSGEGRMFAVYEHPEHEDWTLWITTEGDRSATTVLFPDEY